jgi:hypothetical protein
MDLRAREAFAVNLWKGSGMPPIVVWAINFDPIARGCIS